MLDHLLIPKLRKPLRFIASAIHRTGLRADQVTLAGFAIGLLSIPFIANGYLFAGLICLLLNRLLDGLDGELARIDGASQAGAFLDITLDFIFYAAFPIGFMCLDPDANAFPAAVLVASFMGTGASFLAFASAAAKLDFEQPHFGYKGLYYLDGLMEGTETIAFFVLMCLLPGYFPVLAWVFAGLCVVTTVNRIWFGYWTIRGGE